MSDIAVCSKLISRLRYMGAAGCPLLQRVSAPRLATAWEGTESWRKAPQLHAVLPPQIFLHHKSQVLGLPTLSGTPSRRRGDDKRRSYMRPQSQKKPWKRTCQEVGSAPRGQGQSECSNVEGPQSNL